MRENVPLKEDREIKKGVGHLLKTTRMKYEFNEGGRSRFAVVGGVILARLTIRFLFL